MSTLKITNSGLENSILKDGQFVFGCVNGSDSSIISDASGSYAGGYLQDTGYIKSSGEGSYAHGYVYNSQMCANGKGAHAEGCETVANADYSHAEGYRTFANGEGAHAEGCDISKIDTYINFKSFDGPQTLCPIEAGNNNTLQNVIDEGHNIIEYNNVYTKILKVYPDFSDATQYLVSLDNPIEYSSNESIQFIIDGAQAVGSHTEGLYTVALGTASHAEGCDTQAGEILYTFEKLPFDDLTIGPDTITVTSQPDLAQYDRIKVSNNEYLYVVSIRISEEQFTIELSDNITDTQYEWLHENGIWKGIIQNNGQYSHAGGIGTIANKDAMTAIGKYNNTSVGNIGGDYLFVVGNGTASATASRSNAFAVTTNGITASTLNLSGGRYQEERDPDSDPETFRPGGKIAWSDGNCYIEETDVDELTIYADNGLQLKSNGVNINTNTIISGTVKAKVNNISNVQLGVPIGSMTMWLGASVWGGYHYAVENYPDYIPDGWLLANGASVRLRYIDRQNRSDDQHVTTFHNNTDYVYIPRYTIDNKYDNDFDRWDKFELVAYRHNEYQWVAIDSEYSKFNRPNECYVGMNSSEKKIFTRFLNHVILSTRVYVIQTSVAPTYDSQITKDTSYNNDTYNPDSGITDANYLESYRVSNRQPIIMLSWYSNPVIYSNNSNTGKFDDILIALPDMNLKFPLGARQGDITNNFGDVSTMIGHPASGTNYANTFIGASGGEETHKLSMLEIAPAGGGLMVSTNPKDAGAVGWLQSQKADQAHNNIPPYMAVHFIIKYK